MHAAPKAKVPGTPSGYPIHQNLCHGSGKKARTAHAHHKLAEGLRPRELVHSEGHEWSCMSGMRKIGIIYVWR